VIIDHGSKTPSLIYEFLETESWFEIIKRITDYEVRYYTYQILKVNFNNNKRL
jgi:hypothetical protein